MVLDDFKRNTLKVNISTPVSIASISRLADSSRYTFDYDVYLESEKRNLQRDLVWQLFQKQELIYSILEGKIIPPLSLIFRRDRIIQNQPTHVKVIDGKQRLNAVLDFVNDKFPITKKDGYEEFYYSDLKESGICDIIDRFSFMAHLYSEEVDTDEYNLSDEQLISWFNYVNFMGVQIIWD